MALFNNVDMKCGVRSYMMAYQSPEGGVCCTEEICDGKDNDCDGEIDEGGVCCEPSDEVCDDKDNDCDGEIDEDGVCDVPPEPSEPSNPSEPSSPSEPSQPDPQSPTPGQEIHSPDDTTAVYMAYKESCSASGQSRAPQPISLLFGAFAALGLAVIRRRRI